MQHAQTFAGVRCACGAACALLGALYSVGVALTLIFWGAALSCGKMIDKVRRGHAFFVSGGCQGGACACHANNTPSDFFTKTTQVCRQLKEK